MPIYRPGPRALTDAAHVSGQETQAAKPPYFLLKIEITTWHDKAEAVLQQHQSQLSREYLPRREEGAAHATEGDVVAEAVMQLCHPVHLALRCAFPTTIHGSEVTSPPFTLGSSTHVACADKAYLRRFQQALPEPFAVLEFKNVSVIKAAEFRKATISSSEAFNLGMKDKKAHQLKSRSNARTLLQQATNYSKAFGTPYVAIADMRTLVLLVFPLRHGSQAGAYTLVTVVEEPEHMRKALLGFLLMAHENRETPNQIWQQVLSEELREWASEEESGAASPRGSPAAGAGERRSGRITGRGM
ncbi:hypothetical protein ACHAPE_007724 [Trichoderma viride]